MRSPSRRGWASPPGQQPRAGGSSSGEPQGLGDHAYRTEGGTSAAKSSASTPRAPRAEKVVISFQDQLAGKDLSRARDYSPKETFQLDDVIKHPTFGLGIVSAVRGDKIEIAFKADSKTLIHGRGGAPAAKPAYHPPAAATSGPADKPQPVSPDKPE
jgi:hypothetical protein